MNILATGMEWFTENPGGLPRYFADYISSWQRHGDRIAALVRTGQQSYPSFPKRVKAVYLDTPHPTSVHRVWREALHREMRNSTFDVFNPHFAYYAWSIAGFGGRRAFNLPVVTHFHGPWAYESQMEAGERRRVSQRLQFHVQKAIEQRVYRSTDRFIVLSRNFADQLQHLYGVDEQRIHIIPGAVETEHFQDTRDRAAVRRCLNLPQEAFVIVAVRRMARRMGLENLVRAFARLKSEHKHLHLILVGDGELRSDLARLVAELGLSRCIDMPGRVSDQQLPLYYQAADLAVVPSLALEGFGLSTVEAMACGTPVMGTPIGGTKEILEQFCPSLLFAGIDIDAVYHGLREVLAGATALPSRAYTRQHILCHYTWDAVIPQIRLVFTEALEERGGMS